VGLIIKKDFMIGLFILILALSGTIAWLWAGGIDYMQKFHPDYKGEDFLDWDTDEQDKEQIL
jgi:hypothetical protein